MSILKIARMGHPVLSEKALEVSDPTDGRIKRLVDDMIDTLDDAGGVGLAAPQVHVPLRVVIFQVPAQRMAAERYAYAGLGDGDDGIPLTVLINPVIEPMGDDQAAAFESCLSLPGMMGKVARWTHIRYSGQDLDGGEIVRDATGFHARVVQHECDHLDGRLYPARMTDLSDFGYIEEMKLRAGAS